jgi:hypothetical protein
MKAGYYVAQLLSDQSCILQESFRYETEQEALNALDTMNLGPYVSNYEIVHLKPRVGFVATVKKVSLA